MTGKRNPEEARTEMSARCSLPHRRLHEVVEFEHGGIAYRAGVACFDDGGVAEVFLDDGKVGSAIQVHAHDSAVILSIALQQSQAGLLRALGDKREARRGNE